MANQNPTSSSLLLRTGGAFTAVFSLVMGLLVLFVIPSACSFLSGLELIILGFLFIVGVASFFLGNALLRRKMGQRLTPNVNCRSQLKGIFIKGNYAISYGTLGDWPHLGDYLDYLRGRETPASGQCYWQAYCKVQNVTVWKQRDGVSDTTRLILSNIQVTKVEY